LIPAPDLKQRQVVVELVWKL
jgi:hypothetical protein